MAYYGKRSDGGRGGTGSALLALLLILGTGFGVYQVAGNKLGADLSVLKPIVMVLASPPRFAEALDPARQEEPLQVTSPRPLRELEVAGVSATPQATP